MKYLKRFNESNTKYLLPKRYTKDEMNKLEDTIVEIFDEFNIPESKKGVCGHFAWWNDCNAHITIGNIPKDIIDDIFKKVKRLKPVIQHRFGMDISIKRGNNIDNGWISIIPKGRKILEAHYDNDVLRFLYDLDNISNELNSGSSDSWGMSLWYNFDESSDYIEINFSASGYSDGFSHEMKVYNYKKMMGELRVEETESWGGPYGDGDDTKVKMYESYDDIIAEIKSHFGI